MKILFLSLTLYMNMEFIKNKRIYEFIIYFDLPNAY
jgi:hypothetical protein